MKNYNYNIHSYYLPSYEECKAMCDAHGELVFYEVKTELDGYLISAFNYRLANFKHFVEALEGTDVRGHEMRGITFVFNTDGSLFKRYILLDKFFNVDQTPCSMYSIVKNFEVANVYIKEDGSVVNFIMLPNSKIVSKSKMSFISEQAKEVQDIFDADINLQNFVRTMLEKDIMPVFEFVSPRNRIVLQYDKTELILLRLRCNKTGEYLKLEGFNTTGIKTAVSVGIKTLDELIALKGEIKDIEGWIVQFTNGKMVKVKGEHYCALHGVLTEALNRENDIIALVLDNKIDDVLGQLTEQDSRRINVNQIVDIVNFEMIKLKNDTSDLLKHFNGIKKDFAITYNKNKNFPLAMSKINGKDLLKNIELQIRKETNHLLEARTWLAKRGWVKN
jgi:T4 RnlA family RNA ligase